MGSLEGCAQCFLLLHVPLSVGVGFLVASGLNRRVFFAVDSEQFLTLLDQRSRIGFSWMLCSILQGPINQLLVSLGVEIPMAGLNQVCYANSYYHCHMAGMGLT